MAVANFNDLILHVNHDLECVTYGDKANVAIECLNCGEVLIDFDNDDRQIGDTLPESAKPDLAKTDALFREDEHERDCDAHLTEDDRDCTCKPSDDAEAPLELPSPGELPRSEMAKAIGLDDHDDPEEANANG